MAKQLSSGSSPKITRVRVIGCGYEIKDDPKSKHFKLIFKCNLKKGDMPHFEFVDDPNGSGKFAKLSVERYDSKDLNIAQYSPRPFSIEDLRDVEIMKDVKQDKPGYYKVKLRTSIELGKYFKPPTPPSSQTDSSSSD